MDYHLECINCGERYDPHEVVYCCRKCGDLLDIKYNYDQIMASLSNDLWLNRPLSVWRYRELLPITDFSRIISLDEGGTSLQKCTRLGGILGLEELYVKNEGENPTGSFKDRGMTVGISKAVELGFQNVVCASTGNTSASLSAYSAKAGIQATVFVPSGKVAVGKLVQAIIHGARIVKIKGSFDEALRSIFYLAGSRSDVYLLNSVNPYRIEGQKTLAYEIYHQLMNNIPDTIVLPVGNAGNISAIWKGFVELKRLGLSEKLPRMLGIQAAGAAPLVTAFKLGQDKIRAVENPETIATAIRIGSPVNWKKALKAVYDSEGAMETVSDEEILEAQKLLARYEGLFVEPASASSIAGLKKLKSMGLIDASEKVICVATGHGLKDPEIVIKAYNDVFIGTSVRKSKLAKIVF